MKIKTNTVSMQPISKMYECFPELPICWNGEEEAWILDLTVLV